jgi:hypothetical protein
VGVIAVAASAEEAVGMAACGEPFEGVGDASGGCFFDPYLAASDPKSSHFQAEKHWTKCNLTSAFYLVAHASKMLEFRF